MSIAWLMQTPLSQQVMTWSDYTTDTVLADPSRLGYKVGADTPLPVGSDTVQAILIQVTEQIDFGITISISRGGNILWRIGGNSIDSLVGVEIDPILLRTIGANPNGLTISASGRCTLVVSGSDYAVQSSPPSSTKVGF